MNTNRIALVAALAVGAALGISARAEAQARPSKAQVQRVVDSLARAFTNDKVNGAPGVSIAVVRGNDTVVMKGYGMADLENDVPATPQTVYRIGSITKQFTSAAVMQLVQDGKVKLDDSIGTYLPTLPVAWRGATVRQFLNHTSGVPSYTDIGARWPKRWGEEMTPDSIIAMTANDTLWFKPGTSWRYDNGGYIVLGMLVEKVTGHPWGTELENRLFKPLGLTSTTNCLTTPLIRHRAQGYQPVKGEWTNSQYLAMSQPYAAGALCSTVGDLAAWDHALGTGKVVTAASYTQMTTPEGAASKGRLRYGFGLSTDTLAGHRVIRHSGGIPGFISGQRVVPGRADVGDGAEQLRRGAVGLPAGAGGACGAWRAAGDDAAAHGHDPVAAARAVRRHVRADAQRPGAGLHVRREGQRADEPAAGAGRLPHDPCRRQHFHCGLRSEREDGVHDGRVIARRR